MLAAKNEDGAQRMTTSRRDAFIMEISSANREIVPVDEFLNEISLKTGWSRIELKSKDIGEIEERVKVKALKPNNLYSVKRGKSMSDLYSFIDSNKKQKALKSIDVILNQ